MKSRHMWRRQFSKTPWSFFLTLTKLGTGINASSLRVCDELNKWMAELMFARVIRRGWEV